MTEQNEAMRLINEARAQARTEGLKNFLFKQSKKISIIAIVAVVSVVGFFAFNIYQNSQQQKFSVILHQSLVDQQIGEIEKAKEGLKKIVDAKTAPSGVKSLAQLRYAAFFLAEGKNAEAAKLYSEVSNCHSCDAYVRELASLLLVKVWMSDELEIAKDDLPARIEKLEKSSKILHYQIAEQLALLELQKNNLEKSYKIFESISKNPESSPAVKGRAVDGLKMVEAKGYQPKAEVKSEVKTKK
jgi:hypothetical protein